MSAVFLAFANSSENRLPTLSMEDDQVYATLAQRQVQQHFTVHRDSFLPFVKSPIILSFIVIFSAFFVQRPCRPGCAFLRRGSRQRRRSCIFTWAMPEFKIGHSQWLLHSCTSATFNRITQSPNRRRHQRRSQ
ncbi:MAG: hypothetical protein IPJ74_13555 [Saprospiraceae bacterium]|nr:hypothetical protein [Saprospiraceae bacterium]